MIIRLTCLVAVAGAATFGMPAPASAAVSPSPTYGCSPLPAPAVGMASSGAGGYWLADKSGTVADCGSAAGLGSREDEYLNAPVVGIASTPDGRGYWEVAADGGVFAFGDAGFYGSAGGGPLASCAPAQLALGKGPSYGLAGTGVETLVLHNVSSRPCTLAGYPSVSLLGPGGSATNMTASPEPPGFVAGPPYSDQPFAPRLVTIPPDQSAFFVLNVSDIRASGAPPCETAAEVSVVPPGSSAPLTLTTPISVCYTGDAGYHAGISPVFYGDNN